MAGMPIDVTQTAAAGAANVCEVTIQVVDKDNAPLAGRFFLDVWLSDSASGEGLTSHAADSLLVKAASGTKWLPANASYVRIQTKADGSAIVQITDTHKTLFNVCVQHALWTIPNVAAISAADKYGA